MRQTALVAIALLAAPGPIVAQTTSFVGEALAATPVGALTPMMSPAMTGRTLDGGQLGLRYGLRWRSDTDVQTQNIAAVGLFSIGLKSSMALTAGIRDSDCDGCTPRLLLGLGADMRVYETSFFVGHGSGFALSVSGDLGYGSAFGEEDAYSLGIGAPLTASFAMGDQDGLRIVPYLTPVFGIGQTDCPLGFAGCEESGTQLILGGGIGMWNPMTSISASLGFNRVMQDEERTIFGVNIMIGGR